MSFYDFVIEKIGKNSVTVVDAEMIDDSDDYKMLFEELFGLTGGELALESFSAGEIVDEEADITIKVSGTEHTLNLAVMGWIDMEFIEKFNQILIEKGMEKRFYDFWAMDSFGQESGYFYCDSDKADEVFEYAAKINENAQHDSELYKISNGVKEEGYQDL